MSVKKYLIKIDDIEKFEWYHNKLAVNHLLSKKSAINPSNIIYLGEEINWLAKAKLEAKNIWDKHNLASKNLEETYLEELASQYTGDRFTDGTDRVDTALDCLRELSEFDIDEWTARASIYWEFLQDRASETFTRAVLNELMNMTEN